MNLSTIQNPLLSHIKMFKIFNIYKVLSEAACKCMPCQGISESNLKDVSVLYSQALIPVNHRDYHWFM